MNWKKIIKQLNTQHTDDQLAALAKCHRTTIVRLRGGQIADPHYSVGARIVAEHRRVFPHLY